jgi:cytoskeletal protein RodZ
MFSVAEVLQHARLDQGLDLATVAARTKINVKWLKAIEAGDHKSLPGGFFYKSFVHQYATSLGLDTTAIDAETNRLLSTDIPPPLPGKDNQTARVLPYRSQTGLTYYSYAALVLLLVAWAAVDHGWYKCRKVVTEARTQEMPSPTIGRVSLASVSRVAPQPAVGAPAGSRVQLDLRATEETWLSVSSDGVPVFTGLLAANQTKTIESEGDTRLLVGNAAGLEVRVNGKPLGPLGVQGQVRVLDFRPDKLQFVPPPREND